MASKSINSSDRGTAYNYNASATGHGRYDVEMFTYPEDLFGFGA